MTPTRPGVLVAVALVAFGCGLLLVVVVDAVAGRLLLVPWGAALAMALVALAVLGWAVLARPRLQRRPGHPPLDPMVAARTAALAMAASRTGAAVLGFYAAIAASLVSELDTGAGRSSAGAATATAVAGLALAAVAYWLETLCRLPGDDDEAAGGRAAGATEHGGAADAGPAGAEPARRVGRPPVRGARPGPAHAPRRLGA